MCFCWFILVCEFAVSAILFGIVFEYEYIYDKWVFIVGLHIVMRFNIHINVNTHTHEYMHWLHCLSEIVTSR